MNSLWKKHDASVSTGCSTRRGRNRVRGEETADLGRLLQPHCPSRRAHLCGRPAPQGLRTPVPTALLHRGPLRHEPAGTVSLVRPGRNWALTSPRTPCLTPPPQSWQAGLPACAVPWDPAVLTGGRSSLLTFLLPPQAGGSSGRRLF